MPPAHVFVPVRDDRESAVLAFWLSLESRIEKAADADELLDLRIEAANRSMDWPGEAYWFESAICKADVRLREL